MRGLQAIGNDDAEVGDANTLVPVAQAEDASYFSISGREITAGSHGRGYSKLAVYVPAASPPGYFL